MHFVPRGLKERDVYDCTKHVSQKHDPREHLASVHGLIPVSVDKSFAGWLQKAGYHVFRIEYLEYCQGNSPVYDQNAKIMPKQGSCRVR